MTAFTELFNGGGDGVAITTGNSVFNFVSGAPEFDTGIVYRVQHSMLIVSDATARYGRKDSLAASACSFSIYVRFGSIVPSSNSAFIRLTDSTGANICAFMLNTAGRIAVADTTGASINTPPTNIAGHAVSVNNWYRVDGLVNIGASTGRVRYRICNVNAGDSNTPITTPYDSTASQNLGANNIGRFYVGAAFATTRNGVWNVGILRYDDTRTTFFDQYGGLLKVWNGSAWASKPIRVGASWTETNLKRWNGSAWVTTSN